MNEILNINATSKPLTAAALNPLAFHTTSDKYQHTNTSKIVSALEDGGWEVFKAGQSRVRNAEKEGFQKHFIQMRMKAGEYQVGDSLLTLLLLNSHDGTSALKLMLGLFRLVCENGLIVSQGNFFNVSLRHTLENIELEAIDGAKKLVALAPSIQEQMKAMQSIELTPEQRLAFAKDALAITWPTGKQKDIIRPAQMLEPRRMGDVGNDVWKTFNVIQENALRGGLGYTTLRNDGEARNNSTRSVTGIARNVDINRSLWELAAQYAKVA